MSLTVHLFLLGDNGHNRKLFSAVAKAQVTRSTATARPLHRLFQGARLGNFWRERVRLVRVVGSATALTGSFGLVADISVRLDLSPASKDCRAIVQVALVLPPAQGRMKCCFKDVLSVTDERFLRGILSRPALPLDEVLEILAALALVQNILHLPFGRLVVVLFIVLFLIVVIQSEGRV